MSWRLPGRINAPPPPRRAGARRRRLAFAVLLALAAASPAGAADPAPPNHSGSAQPFVGFHKLNPIVMRNVAARVVIEPFVRFRPEHLPTLLGTGPHAFSAQAQTLAQSLIQHRLTILWLDRGKALNRDDVTGVITETINEVTRIDAVDLVTFTRFSIR